jgi:bleomycin hydrolase
MKKITIKDIKQFSKKYNKDKNNKLIENAITNNGVNEIALNRSVLNENKMVFNIELPESMRYDQKDSGRCWCFAGLNFIKHNIAKNMNIDLEKFNLSANYLTFFDKLEKMNTIIEEVINLKDDSFNNINRLKILDYDEGGNWEDFKRLIEKYGIIPIDYMKENVTTESSDLVNKIIDLKIKRDVYKIISFKKSKNVKDWNSLTKGMVEENYILLAKLLGEPPNIINLEYRDKRKKLINKKLTPQEFFIKFCDINLDDYVVVSSIDMYNKEYYKKYVRKYGESINKKSESTFINLPKKELKKLMLRQLKNKEPVWFASEINIMCSRDNCILDTRVYSYEDLFNFKILTSSEGLNFLTYASSHAMCMVGVHLIKNKSIRWKVENSWGDNKNNGYFIMNDNYFDKFVMQGVINKKYLNAKQLKILDSSPIDIKPYDPI